ncbi:TIGR02234 family membrane protein [Corynebacterium riegelii]|uniref:TIGR02234 family membrane protein n=1 Tax=Corynebacterium riegelii TaxID=156976 RepID=UPI000C769EBE|nr:TIGR02234 family membrane protein [Corynebacterium riegelii]PLA13084.1 TIGR02234 family membrane protein [Corynebacterium riegelii]
MAPHKVGAILIALGATLLAVFSRVPWITATYEDSLSGGGVAQIRGADWSTETTAVALLLFVGALGAFALRRLGRRTTAIISAIAAVGAAVSPVMLLARGADAERVHALLTTGADAAQTTASKTELISEWAEITATDISTAFPLLTLLGAALAVVGAVVVALRPGQDVPKLSKYEKEAVRRKHLEEDMEARPDSGRVMWDALDADIDPTDFSTGR